MALNSCQVPAYLPSSKDIDINNHGSYIKMVDRTNSKMKGELIAIDSSGMYILTTDTNPTNLDSMRCYKMPIDNIKSFKIRYASPRFYGWTIPVFLLAVIGHGYYAVLTLPANLVVPIAVSVSSENSFQYKGDIFYYEYFKMFARFPQGIPPNIDIKNIK